MTGHFWDFLEGEVFIDRQLPFGLASATAIFSAVGEALEWVLRQREARAVVHYLDDFLFAWSPARTSVGKHYPLH